MTAILKTFSSFDGTKIHYEIIFSDNTKKRTLIFLHGLGGDLSAWKEEVDYFNKLGYKTVAVDFRGHGLSDRKYDVASYRFDNFVEDIISLIKYERIERPIIIGHCLGGMITMMLAIKYPGLADVMILVDTGYKTSKLSHIVAENFLLRNLFLLAMKFAPKIHKKGHVNFKNFIGTTDYDWKRILSDVTYVSLKSYLLICRNLWDFDLSNQLSAINIPTLVIEGSKDSIFPLDIAKEIHRKIIKSDLHVIDNANHILVINNPNELNLTISNYLSKQKI